MNQDISVVMPSHNRGSILKKVLPSYLEPLEVKEVIVVDDASIDDTQEILGLLSKNEPKLVTIRFPKNRGLACATNAGIKAASGDYLFLTDDDVELTEGFFGILKDHMKMQNADVIAARRIWIYPWEDKKSAKAHADLKKGPFIIPPNILGDPEVNLESDIDVPIVPIQALAKKKVFENISFDEGYKGYTFRIESDFMLTVKEHGFKLVFCPHAVCYHLHSKCYAAGQKRSWYMHNKWILKNQYRFLKKHEKDFGRLLGVKGGARKLFFNFFIFWLWGQIRNILHIIKRRVVLNLK